MSTATAINPTEGMRDSIANRDPVSVCQLVHGLPIGGAEVLVDRLIRQLRARFRFIVVCLDQVGELGERLAAESIPVVCLKRRPGFDWRCVQALHRLLESERIDVVHAHQYTPFAYGIATRIFGRRPPVLFTEHGRFFPDYPNWKRKAFNSLLRRRSDRFVAVGHAVREALVNNEGLPRTRIQVVYNGIDLSRSQSEPCSPCQVRESLGIAKDAIVVLTVARLDPIKDHRTALAAIARAVRQIPQLRYLIVGDGPQRESIEREITSLGLRDTVSMLGTRRDVNAMLSASDIFLLTSVSEGIPVTILEAMAAGVPVVATEVGGVPELVDDGVTGFLAPASDSAALADSIVRLCASAELRRSVAERARQRVASDFSQSTMIDEYARLYQEMTTRDRVES